MRRTTITAKAVTNPGRKPRQPDQAARARAGIPLDASDAPDEGSDAGDDADLEHARVLAVIGEYRSAANHHFKSAKSLIGRNRASAESQARRAIDQATRAFWWAEDTPLEDREHHLMHAIGRWTRRHFGCRYPFDGAAYARTCPIDIAHKRFGVSVGFIGQRVCSICGDDLSECPHIRGRSYWVRGGPGAAGLCPVCLQDRCPHSRDRLYRVAVYAMVTRMQGRKASWVSRPADPEARMLAIPVSPEVLRERFGPSFKLGTPVSCDKCLGDCWGFDELPANADLGRVGTVVAAALAEEQNVDLTLAIPDTSAIAELAARDDRTHAQFA